jgi:hypothetical protein
MVRENEGKRKKGSGFPVPLPATLPVLNIMKYGWPVVAA